MAIATSIRCSLWFQPHPSGPNANKTPYIRSAGFLNEPYIDTRAISVTNFVLDNVNETYLSFDVPSTATNLKQAYIGLASNGEASVGFVTGYVTWRDGPFGVERLFFANRGVVYVVNGNPLYIRVELIGQKLQVGFGVP